MRREGKLADGRMHFYAKLVFFNNSLYNPAVTNILHDNANVDKYHIYLFYVYCTETRKIKNRVKTGTNYTI